jgi:prepilin-type N-terminal cleavage/methylation domain-containing protein
MNTTHTNSKKEGFTMIEMLVAVFILVFAVSGPLVFVAQSLQSAFYARDQVTAFYLTQETVELIKSIRDNNALDSTCGAAADWLTCTGVDTIGLNACIDANCVVGLERDGTIYVSGCSGLSDPDCELLESTSDTNDLMYAYPSGGVNWEASRFQRKVRINILNEEEFAGGSEAEIKVTIEWRTGPIERNFTVRQNITNWIPVRPLIP